MLERLQVAVRARTPWEAADLGLALLRAWAGPVWRVWAALLVPLGAALLALCHRAPWAAVLIVWWLKPALGRPVLHVLAKATFGDVPGLLETFRSAPGYGRRGLGATLLWRRCAAERSLLLPVWQLEAPDGGRFRRRRRVLLQRGGGQARLLTFTCQLFTLVLFLGAVAAVGFFAPGQGTLHPLAALFAGPGGRLHGLDAALPALAILAMGVVEPFYLAAGFGLYLNRRVQLEGWDLELAFRQLGQRARRQRPGGALALALLLALVPLRLGAQDRPAQPHSRPKAVLAEVLSGPEFATTRPSWSLRLRRPPSASAPLSPPLWLEELIQRTAALLRWVIPAALVLALAWLLWTRRRALARREGRPPASPPGRSSGLDPGPGPLPADPAGAALALWDQGRPRAALALLYRCALAHLAHGLGAPVTAASTEAECLSLAERRLPPGAAQYFQRLLEAWQGAAYAGRAPAPEDRDLCSAWAAHFPGSGT